MFTKFLCWAHVRGHVLWTCVSILKNLLLLFLYLLCICILVFQINIFQFNSIQSSPGGQNPGRGLGRSLCQLHTTGCCEAFHPSLTAVCRRRPSMDFINGRHSRDWWCSATVSCPSLRFLPMTLIRRPLNYDGRWTSTTVVSTSSAGLRRRSDGR